MNISGISNAILRLNIILGVIAPILYLIGAPLWIVCCLLFPAGLFAFSCTVILFFGTLGLPMIFLVKYLKNVKEDQKAV